MIQDAAVKCRFCGEWLDPSKRPAWSLDAAPSRPPVETKPGPPTLTESTAAKPRDPDGGRGPTFAPPEAGPAAAEAGASQPAAQEPAAGSRPNLGVPMPKTPRWTPPAGLAHDLESRGEPEVPPSEALPPRERSMTAVGMPSAADDASDVPEKRDAERMAEKMERLKEAARQVRDEATYVGHERNAATSQSNNGEADALNPPWGTFTKWLSHDDFGAATPSDVAAMIVEINQSSSNSPSVSPFPLTSLILGC